MNHHPLIEASGFGESRFEFITFFFASRRAKAVFIAGTFNAWQAHANPMHRLEDGFHWMQEMALHPGIYEYCMVVDGEWMSDPRSEGTIANPFGGRNSLLMVGIPHQFSDKWSMPT